MGNGFYEPGNNGLCHFLGTLQPPFVLLHPSRKGLAVTEEEEPLGTCGEKV